MAVNNVVYAGNTLIDLRGDTVTPGALALGVTAHGANGETITGTVPLLGTLGGNNIITLSGDLADGKYTLMYKDAEGNLVEVGTIQQGEETFVITLSWIEALSVNESYGGQLNAYTAYTALTPVIPIVSGAKYTVSHDGALNSSTMRIYARQYDEDGVYLGRSDSLISSSGSQITFLDGAVMFRLEGIDNAIAYDPSVFAPSVTLKTTVTSDVVNVPFTLTNGIKLDKNTGAESSDSTYMASNYIEVDTSYVYRLFCASNAYASCNINCFNSSKTQIGYLANVIASVSADQPNDFSSGDLALPSGTAYIRLRAWHGSTSAENQLKQFLNNYTLMRYPA